VPLSSVMVEDSQPGSGRHGNPRRQLRLFGGVLGPMEICGGLEIAVLLAWWRRPPRRSCISRPNFDRKVDGIRLHQSR
jgi:hypothetical protein